MSHVHYKKIFQDEEGGKKLQEMLILRQQGWSLPKLAIYFNCDHSSISYWVRKFGIKPGQKVIRQLPKCKVCGKIVNAIQNKFCSLKCYSQSCKIEEKKEEFFVEGEKICEGKTYAEYCEIENLKKTERFKNNKIVLGLS